MRGILLRGGGAVPRRCQREAVLCCCRNVFAVRHIFGGVGGYQHKRREVEVEAEAEEAVGRWVKTLPMLPLATLIKTGCH